MQQAISRRTWQQRLKKEGFEGIATESRGYYGIRYEELIAFRIAAIKRNQKKIEELRRLRNGN